jgi:L-amino acid N-acyltransferase YncA
VTVSPLFTDPQPGPQHEAEITPALVDMARAVASIAATRILLLVAVLAGCGIWGFTIVQPTRDRLAAAAAYSLVFVLPLVALYLKRG